MDQGFSCRTEIEPSSKTQLLLLLDCAARGNVVQICRTSPVFSVLVQSQGLMEKMYAL